MLTSQELSDLRGKGVKDTEILGNYREFDPSSSGDIDSLLKRGEEPGKILDGLVAYHARSSTPEASPKPDPMADKSAWEKTRGALQSETARGLAGLASTAKVAGWKKTSEAFQGAANAMAPAQEYDPARGRVDVTDPSTWGYIPRAVLETVPGMAMDLTAGAVGGLAGPAGAVAGFTASNAARNFGPNLEARMEHQKPGASPTTGDYAAAAGSTVAEAALSRVGLTPALSGVAKGAGMSAVSRIPAQVLKAIGYEAAAGGAGDVVNQVGRTAGTEKGLEIDPKEIGNTALLSGAMGGAVRAGRGIGDVTNAVRFRGMDQDAAARVVERMDRNGIEPKDPSAAFKTVEMARRTLDAEIGDAAQVLNPRLQANDRSADVTRVLLKDTRAILKTHEEAPTEHLQRLRERLGDTEEGSRLVGLLEERQALNQLSGKGYFDPTSETFAGGMAANPVVDATLNPLANLKLKLGIGGASGLAGAAGLPIVAQAGVLGPALAKVAAAQAGAYGAVRTVDNVTGLRNPTKEFTDRFRGLQKLDGREELPSFRQEAADTRAQVQSDRDAKATERQTFKDNSAALKQMVQAAEARRKLMEKDQPSPSEDTPLEIRVKPRVQADGTVTPGKQASANPETFSVEHGDQIVLRPREGIRNWNAYAVKTKQRMMDRQEFADDLMATTADTAHPGIVSMLTKLNSVAKNWKDADGIIKRQVDEMPEEFRSIARDILKQHEGKLRGTYGE